MVCPWHLRQPLSVNNNLGSLINSPLAGTPRTTGTPRVNGLGVKIRIEGPSLPSFKLLRIATGRLNWPGLGRRVGSVNYTDGSFCSEKASGWFDGVTSATIKSGEMYGYLCAKWGPEEINLTNKVQMICMNCTRWGKLLVILDFMPGMLDSNIKR